MDAMITMILHEILARERKKPRQIRGLDGREVVSFLMKFSSIILSPARLVLYQEFVRSRNPRDQFIEL